MDKKVCLVTGASGDIGKAVCEKFLNEDYFVVMIASGLHKLEQTIEDKGFDKNSVMTLAIDVSSEEAVKEGIKEVERRCGRIDTLVNTAGICGEYNLTTDTEYDNFKRIYEVNVFGTFLMIKHSIPLMLETGNASIVNFGSVSGMMGYSYEVGYGSSKWAIIGMTKNVANEYGGKGIR
ncbi:MAG: SDR family oxidoreductase, partial [Erysipelotrichaceae bacterium]|nr:SDR family oxidoreductase [Erysipelotrichaceae bacterium]